MKNNLIYGIVAVVILAIFVFIPNPISKGIINKENINKDTGYEYEICDNSGECRYVAIDNIIEPSEETFYVCNSEGSCEDVPVNRLLLKHGTNKQYCSDAPYLEDSYVDNWWNANGLIDECEMPPRADMQFAFKQHNASFSSHSGTIQITVTPINYENSYLALQILVGEDNNNDDLPDGWTFCGNVDSIRGKDKRIINCEGTNMKFVKLVSPEWNQGNLYLDYILIMRVDQVS